MAPRPIPSINASAIAAADARYAHTFEDFLRFVFCKDFEW